MSDTDARVAGNVAALMSMGVPEHALVHPEAFRQWLLYQAPWNMNLSGGMSECPLCSCAVMKRDRHAAWHVAELSII